MYPLVMHRDFILRVVIVFAIACLGVGIWLIRDPRRVRPGAIQRWLLGLGVMTAPWLLAAYLATNFTSGWNIR